MISICGCYVVWVVQCIITLQVDLCPVFVFFFFKQKTAYEMRISDWSSDVCSSDLRLMVQLRRTRRRNAKCFANGGKTLPFTALAHHIVAEIGRASCRERVCQYV